MFGTGGEGREDGAHLFICLAERKTDKGMEWLLVPICSYHEGNSDRTCRLGKADYDELTKDSFAAYFHLREMTEKMAAGNHTAGHIKAAEPPSEKLFQAICAGVLKSTEAKPKWKTFLKDHGPKPDAEEQKDNA